MSNIVQERKWGKEQKVRGKAGSWGFKETRNKKRVRAFSSDYPEQLDFPSCFERAVTGIVWESI